jgi:Lon protease-like protein
MKESLLPLFPLQVVLFPGSSVPLHIFEERYKTLVRECIAGKKEFGINLVHEKEVLKVGCAARVSTVLHRYEDGRMDIIVEGTRRYRLERYEPGNAPYAVGLVRFLTTSDEEVNSVLAADTVVLYNEFVSKVYGDRVPKVDVHAAEAGLSYRLAQKAGMDLLRRQKLLESDSENDRLEMLNAYLTAMLPRLDRMEEVERIVRSDGYLEQPPE